MHKGVGARVEEHLHDLRIALGDGEVQHGLGHIVHVHIEAGAATRNEQRHALGSAALHGVHEQRRRHAIMLAD